MARKWTMIARRTIAKVIAEHRDLIDLDLKALVKKVDAAYPFGERSHWPYKAWLAERSKALSALAEDPILRKCPACGAGINRQCRQMGDDTVSDVLAIARDAAQEGRTEEARAIYAQACHESRLRQRPDLGSLPLFSEVSRAS